MLQASASLFLSSFLHPSKLPSLPPCTSRPTMDFTFWLPSSSSDPCSPLICLVGPRDLSHSVVNILLQMQSIGYHPDCGTCNYLLSALCAVDQLLEAVKVLRGMDGAGCIPDSNSYGTVIGAMCRVTKTVEEQELMKQLVLQYGVTPGQETQVKLLVALRANREIWKAVEMIEFLEKEGNSVGFESYELVVEGCLEKLEYVLAAKVATGMTERGFMPYIKVRQKNIEGLVSIDEWKIACAVRQRFAALKS